MRVFVVLCVAFMATYRCAEGNTWLEDYIEALKSFSEEDLRKEYPHTATHIGQRALQCPDMSPSSSVPTSVELVKAADIKVIAALGDSLTAGFAINASSLAELLIEYRQLSWSIGGQGTFDKVMTLANIVKLFNPNVTGPSLMPTVAGQPTTLQQTGLNLAVSGAVSGDFPAQARHLIDTMKNYSGINFTKDWKLLTVLIGMNDICAYCQNKTKYSVDNFISNINQSLQTLMDEVPRLIVNVVQILNMEPLRQMQQITSCQLLLGAFCSCIVSPAANSTELAEIVGVNRQYQVKLNELISSGRFFKSDFSVVLQPYLTNTEIPKLSDGSVDLSYFAPDCFHFSQKGQAEMAKGLWNNMFQQEGQKDMLANITTPVTLNCPPQDSPYISTRPSALTSTAAQEQGLWSLLLLALIGLLGH